MDETALLNALESDTTALERVPTSAARAPVKEVSTTTNDDTALLSALESDTTELDRATTSDDIADAIETTWFKTEVVNERLGLF